MSYATRTQVEIWKERERTAVTTNQPVHFPCCNTSRWHRVKAYADGYFVTSHGSRRVYLTRDAEGQFIGPKWCAKTKTEAK